MTAVVVAIIFWAQPPADAAVGLDPSWESGLALAQAQHLGWGPQIVFTFGPLGFLHNSAYYFYGQSVVATAYQIVVLVALFLGMAAALRQRHAPMTSLIGALLTTAIANFIVFSYYPELAVLAAFAWASVPLLQKNPKVSTAFIVCMALAVAAGFELLVKINSAPTMLAIALAVSVLLDWRAVWRHGATVAAFAASVLIWWRLAGQPLGNLPTWLKLSAAVASGYVNGMAIPLPALAIPTVVLTLGWMTLVWVMFTRGSREIPQRFVVLVGLTSLIIAKTALGRFDGGHVFILLALIVLALAITPRSDARHRPLAIGAVAFVFLGVGGPVIGDRALAAVEAPVRAVNRLVALAMPGELNSLVAEAKARQRTLHVIPARFIDAIGSGTVHVDPAEASAVWSYGFAWRPAPVFQTYSAYTPALDLVNSMTLAHGPQFVLSHVSATVPAMGIDGRLATQESPLYSRALLCNYTVNGVENRWALFSRTGPHCGQLTALSEATLHDHEVVPVPPPSAPGKAVLVGIDLIRTVFDQLFQGAVVPLTTSTVVLDGATYRLVAANAAEPFVVSTPSSVNGTNLEIHAHTIGVGRKPSWGLHNASARLRFYEMTVEA